MKKIWIWLVCSIVVLVTMYSLTFTIIKNNVKENVLQQNDDIAHIHQINQIGAWGEWFSEYVLIVEKNGRKYRIWTDYEGNITDQEVL